MLSEDLGKGNVAARQSRIKLQEVQTDRPASRAFPLNPERRRPACNHRPCGTHMPGHAAPGTPPRLSIISVPRKIKLRALGFRV